MIDAHDFDCFGLHPIYDYEGQRREHEFSSAGNPAWAAAIRKLIEVGAALINGISESASSLRIVLTNSTDNPFQVIRCFR